MTLQEHNAKIAKQLAELTSQNKPLYLGVTTMNKDRQVRIFEKGLNSEGRKIGSYSTKVMLATKSQFPKGAAFKPSLIKQKNGKSRPLFLKFPKASKAVPVMVIEGGYKEFRAINGRQNSFVDLTLYGNLKRDTLKTAKLNQHQFITGPFGNESQKKLSGLQRKYGAGIAQHTPEERKKLLEIVLKETMEILK